jgi:hypothetical protein
VAVVFCREMEVYQVLRKAVEIKQEGEDGAGKEELLQGPRGGEMGSQRTWEKTAPSRGAGWVRTPKLGLRLMSLRNSQAMV